MRRYVLLGLLAGCAPRIEPVTAPIVASISPLDDGRLLVEYCSAELGNPDQGTPPLRNCHRSVMDKIPACAYDKSVPCR